MKSVLDSNPYWLNINKEWLSQEGQQAEARIGLLCVMKIEPFTCRLLEQPRAYRLRECWKLAPVEPSAGSLPLYSPLEDEEVLVCTNYWMPPISRGVRSTRLFSL
jgi:hypothetical protein